MPRLVTPAVHSQHSGVFSTLVQNRSSAVLKGNEFAMPPFVRKQR